MKRGCGNVRLACGETDHAARSAKPFGLLRPRGRRDGMEELFKFTQFVRDRADYLTDRYNERKDAAPALANARARTAMQHETNANTDTDDSETE